MTLDETVKIVKIISPFVTLLTVYIVGVWLNSRLENLKSRLQLDHIIIKKRADIYAEIQEDLNDIYGYLKRVGAWKDLVPKDIVARKRKVDKKMYVTRPYWSKEMFSSYEAFMGVCFVTNRGHKRDAGIIGDIKMYQGLKNWEQEFEGSFELGFDESKLDKSNKKLFQALSKDFGVE